MEESRRKSPNGRLVERQEEAPPTKAVWAFPLFLFRATQLLRRSSEGPTLPFFPSYHLSDSVTAVLISNRYSHLESPRTDELVDCGAKGDLKRVKQPPDLVNSRSSCAMSRNALAPEICTRLVHWTRRHDLPTLCRTSKSLQREAEIKLYETIMCGNIHATYRACESIVGQGRLGSYVRFFYIYQDQRRNQREPFPYRFWQMVQIALSKMRSLESLLINDPVYYNTWVLGDTPRIPFQLREARLRFAWDLHLVKFLESQNELRSLFIIDGPEDENALQLEAGSLPQLRILDGPLSTATALVSGLCPLTHVQIALDKDSRLLAFVPRLYAVASSLRALNILNMPEEVTLEALEVVSSMCPNLHHFGILPLPVPSSRCHRFHRALMVMYKLRTLELDIARWSPQPTGALQRALTTELRVYRPSLECVCFWIGANRTLWVLDGDRWDFQSETGQHPQLDALWRNA
ncbi:hypothetical protein BV22DRAFT_260734 [Leucogyrophana mollusca]|uniref:Uncharacterized protein n=1 Tax=Leucogyrophana mollusca TaxID=85980 RepID=A0ACB8BPT6_9AGAM|nr:hypothetical protein BV22DRAFT_260734 [Leucogyrophana mollusca]